MAAGNAVWGIDIGQCGLKALKLQRSGDQVEVVAFDYIEHAKILSQPDADRPTLIRDALDKLLSRNSLVGDPVVVSVAGQQTFSRFTKLPPVETKRIPEIVQFEATQQIPFDMDAVVWDYQTFATEGSPDVEVGIFAIKRELVRSALSHFTDLGLEPIAVQAGPLALYNGLRYDGLVGEGATAILDVGAENSDLIVAEGDSIWSRNIPLGGNNFTEALVKAFKLSFSKAENLKRTATTSKYARQIFQAMRPVFADLVAEIQRSIGFYTSTHRNAKLERMIGMGNAFKLPGLQKFLQQNLGMSVNPPSAFKRLAATQVSGAPQFMEHLLSFGVAYGLAVQGLELSSVNSNLLPPEILKQAVWRKKRPWFGAAAACLLLAAGAIGASYAWSKSALARDRGGANAGTKRMSPEQAGRIITRGPGGDLAPLAYAQTIKAAAETLKKEYTSKSGGWEEEEQKINDIIDLQSGKGLWLKILDSIHRALPKREHALRDASETEDAIKAAYAKVPRGQRKEIFISSLKSEFHTDVYQAAADAAGNANAELTTDGEPGFIVTLEGSTPNSGGDLFLLQNLVNPLNTVTQEGENRGYYFDKVTLQKGTRQRGGGGGKRPAAVRAPGGRPGARAAPPLRGRGAAVRRGQNPGAGTTARLEDPITGESMEKDRLFEVTFIVVLGDRPELSEDTDGTDAGSSRR